MRRCDRGEVDDRPAAPERRIRRTAAVVGRAEVDLHRAPPLVRVSFSQRTAHDDPGVVDHPVETAQRVTGTGDDGGRTFQRRHISGDRRTTDLGGDTSRPSGVEVVDGYATAGVYHRSSDGRADARSGTRDQDPTAGKQVCAHTTTT